MSKKIDAFKGLDYDIMGKKLKTPTPFLPAYKV